MKYADSGDGLAAEERVMNTMKGAIYFDGLCMVCSAEINHYRKLPGSETFDFIDITAQGFKAEDHGLDPAKVHKVMHVRDSKGVLHEGVEAFRTIWKGIPRYHFLARLSENKLVRWTFEQGYKSFVVIRPYLPRKKMDCSASPYCQSPK